MADELKFHLEVRAEHWKRQGLSPEEAARRARLEFGGLEGYKEQCREARGLRLLDELRADLRFATRQLRRAPVFTIVATATLAVAIGANTAIFSLLDAVLLKTLPVARPHELRELEWTARRPRFSHWYNGSSRSNPAGELVATSFAYPAFAYVRDQTTALVDLFCFGDIEQINVGLGGRAELARGQLVSGGFFRGLGVEAVVGRTITPDDDRPGAPAVAVASYRFWQRMLAGETGTPGQTLVVNGSPVVIIGVAPPAFYGVRPGRAPDLMLSMAMQPAVYAIPDMLRSSRHWGFRVMGRLKTGISEEQAQAQTEALVRRAILADPPTGEEYDLPRVALNAGGQGLDHLRQAFARPLFVLMVVVGAVLLIACANIAGLLRARASARRREIGTRLALGAGRGRLARQLLTESVLLAVIGGSLGIALAHALRNLLPRVLSPGPETLQLALEPDPWMLAFSSGVCLLAGVACGILPAVHATRLDLAAMLGRTVSNPPEGPARPWTGKALVTAQVAVSLVLLGGAGLFIRTLVNLRSEALGFRPESLLLFQLDPTLNGYREARLNDFYEQALNRLATLAGVRSATLSRWGILSGHRTTDSISVPGYTDQGKGHLNVHVHYVAPGYFQTMGIPLLQGRDITWRDREGAPRVAIVNQALASPYFGGAAPVGQRMGPEGGAADQIEIVGLAADAKFASLREATPPTLYLPYRQYPQHLMTFAVRATSDPTALLGSIRRTLAALDPNVPLFDVRTQVEQIDLAVRQERLFAHLLSGFALLALVLACLGTYGTLAYSVARRTPEIGLRLALGAERSDVVLMMLRDSLGPVAIGVALGLGGALVGARLVQSMLFGIAGQDSATLAVAVVVLVISALLAAWLPSLRASRLDPMSALRCD